MENKDVMPAFRKIRKAVEDVAGQIAEDLRLKHAGARIIEAVAEDMVKDLGESKETGA